MGSRAESRRGFPHRHMLQLKPLTLTLVPSVKLQQKLLHMPDTMYAVTSKGHIGPYQAHSRFAFTCWVVLAQGPESYILRTPKWLTTLLGGHSGDRRLFIWVACPACLPLMGLQRKK